MGLKGKERKRKSGEKKQSSAAYLQHVAVFVGVEMPVGNTEPAGFDP